MIPILAFGQSQYIGLLASRGLQPGRFLVNLGHIWCLHIQTSCYTVTVSEDTDIEFVIRGPQSFGMAIREFRTLRSINQAELAGRSGIYRSHLYSLERGSTTQAMRDLIAVYRALDLEIVVPEAICRPRYLPGSCQAG